MPIQHHPRKGLDTLYKGGPIPLSPNFEFPHATWAGQPKKRSKDSSPLCQMRVKPQNRNHRERLVKINPMSQSLSKSISSKRDMLFLGVGLSSEKAKDILATIKGNVDVFAWRHNDVVGVDP